MGMKTARRQQGLTLRELSKLTGIKVGILSDLEQKRSVPSSPQYEAIKKILPTISMEDFELDYQKAQERHDEVYKRIYAIGKAVTNIKAKHGKTNAKGTMGCPLCGGKLHYTVAALNGHVWGACETKNCLSWME